MAQITRRAMVQTAGLAGSLAAVAPLAGAPQRAEAAEAAEDRATVFHIFVFHWKEGVTQAEQDRARTEILAFQGVIPGLLQTHAGANLSAKGKGYTFGGMMQFANRAALDAYPQHPAHQALLKWLLPLIEPIELDLNW